jgi:hypothetical protein
VLRFALISSLFLRGKNRAIKKDNSLQMRGPVELRGFKGLEQSVPVLFYYRLGYGYDCEQKLVNSTTALAILLVELGFADSC